MTTTPAPGRPPALLLLGSGTDATVPGAADAPDLLATADAVFAGPVGPDVDPEAAALFYAEAWRVEPIDPRVAAARLDEWFALRPSTTAALVVAGRAEDDVAFGAALDGLAHLRPELRVFRRTGVTVVPPHRSRLTR